MIALLRRWILGRFRVWKDDGVRSHRYQVFCICFMIESRLCGAEWRFMLGVVLGDVYSYHGAGELRDTSMLVNTTLLLSLDS